MRELGLAPLRFLIQVWVTPPNKVPLEVLHAHGNESPEKTFFIHVNLQSKPTG